MNLHWGATARRLTSDLSAEGVETVTQVGNGALAHAFGAIDNDRLGGEACAGDHEAGGRAAVSEVDELAQVNVVDWFLDPAIVQPNPSETVNLEPLLINTTGSWEWGC